MENQMLGHMVLASGGTGGHVFPARALAAELLDRGYKVTLMTDSRGEVYEKLFPGVSILQVNSASPSVGGLLGKFKAAFKLGIGVLQSLIALRKIKPAAVIGFGGYPSMPPAFAASLLGVPVILHEQNAILGRVNRLLAGRATAIATSFVNTEATERNLVRKMYHTGNPVRKEIRELFGSAYPNIQVAEKFRLLITGGSQGATVLSDVVPEAIAALPTDLQKKLEITQQCRPEDLDRVSRVYENTEVETNLSAFFENMPELLSGCHLAIMRSGASTMAELAVAGRPAILVPYKYAMDNHQERNAQTAVERGAAVLISQDEFTVEKLSEILIDLLSHPEKLKSMAMAVTSCAEINAAGNLADLVEEKAKNGKKASHVDGKVIA
ncbi:undecaprenyldiphospho-muramoylpentapeptide beta-N-acetylglucosaminyltransferase [Sneathiella limimaris]|uniref:undecaprenyldiphospho-muramoylpentapeptide beta-N-acetylglucosaminyltransferase n=1 Tax=Sneathiella limimaris TaxID=1964213 RepID=UPI00146ECFB5|nr:undecaprenyldiphospho-muramoylpentapeptide beta-N-acetylglucosaminyltransferase [Sneathiella limimaris]